MPEAGFPRRVVVGEPAARGVARLLEELGARRVLVATDRGIAGAPWFRGLVEGLRGAGFEVEIYDSVPPEPPVGEARRLAGVVRGFGADAVVAVGGGSVIDAAKAAVLLAARPDADPTGVAPFQPLRLEGAPALVAVPATAGTGSEASYALVLTVEEGGYRRKAPAASYELVPYGAVLDPSIPAGAPRRVAVGAAADALSHALEALVAAQANPLSDMLASQAALAVFRAAPRALNEGDPRAWSELQAAAMLAGAAFSSAGLGLAHAVAHPLGALLGVHHGTIVGVALAHVLGLYYEKAPGAAGKLEALRRHVEADGRPHRPTLLHHVLDLYREIGQPAGLGDLGYTLRDLESAAPRVAEEALHDPDIAFAPYIPSPEELEGLVRRMHSPPQPPASPPGS